MAENSRIAWTDHTFNPWKGCTKVSEGCAHCYAMFEADTRYKQVKWGPNGTRVKTADSYWRKPKTWNDRAAATGIRERVFCASWADVFEDWPGIILSSRQVTEEACPENGFQESKFNPVLWHRDDIGVCEAGQTTIGMQRGERHATMNDLRRKLFALIDATPYLDWLLVTKRPENIARMWEFKGGPSVVDIFGPLPDLSKGVPWSCGERNNDHRSNVWLLTSIESQDQAHRWDELSQCRDLAPVLGVSAEPLLGPLDVSSLGCHGVRPDWIIFGGESDQGQPARPCRLDWIDSGVQQCREFGITPFVKQLGSHCLLCDEETAGQPVRVDLQARGGADPEEWPADLRVREFPEVDRV